MFSLRVMSWLFRWRINWRIWLLSWRIWLLSWRIWLASRRVSWLFRWRMTKETAYFLVFDRLLFFSFQLFGFETVAARTGHVARLAACLTYRQSFYLALTFFAHQFGGCPTIFLGHFCL